ncbi:hypothetical protein [Catellatospora sp. NPDC049133]|uniref:hypothetical protein n=1 Tax=Catellatospora sp. NPDC049133 TaxID=3155499 RepID=UPI0033FCB40A
MTPSRARSHSTTSPAGSRAAAGRTLRGLLLTTYGFSEFGVKAGQAALVAYLAALVMFLLSVAGFFHAWITPRAQPFAPIEAVPDREQINA